MDHGEPGVNEFANSVYKVASKDEEASCSSSETSYTASANYALDDMENASDSFSDESDSLDMNNQTSYVYPSENTRFVFEFPISFGIFSFRCIFN